MIYKLWLRDCGAIFMAAFDCYNHELLNSLRHTLRGVNKFEK